MSAVTMSGALTSRKEVSAPLSSHINEDNTVILSGLPDVLTPEQVAKVLQISITGARQMCREGLLPAFKCGAQWRIPRQWLIQFIAGENKGGNHEPAL